MARGGARPGAGRKAGKNANTSPVSRGRAHAREAGGNQRPWPADKVERWAIDRLIPYARNARTHSDEQVAQIAASIREFGFTNPVLVDEAGTLIAGHGRVLGTMIAPTGARPGRYSPGPWLMFGTPTSRPGPCRSALRDAASAFAPRSFGRKTISRSAAAIIMPSTSRAGTRSARVAPRLGSATILRRRCGRSTKI